MSTFKEELDIILSACERLGWGVAVPTSDILQGLIIGTGEFVDQLNELPEFMVTEANPRPQLRVVEGNG